MKKTHIFILTVILTFLGFLGGNITGMIITLRNIEPQDENLEEINVVITSQTIIERIQHRAFLVTNSIISQEETQIVVDYNSDWSNFWWGKELTATANVQTDIGLDLTKLLEEDIAINHEEKTITITLPDPEVFNSSVVGDIDTTSSLGVFKKLFPDDPNDDYNLAKQQLTDQARAGVGGNEEYLASSKEAGANSISFLLDSFEYEIVFESE